jgi:hypothetical protein
MSKINKASLKQSYNTYASERDKSIIEPWKANERDQLLRHIKSEGSNS